MKIRLFGSQICDKCQTFKRVFKVMNIPFDFIDALADDTQDLCDEHSVMNLPHVQILDDKGDIQWVGSDDVSLPEVLLYIKYHDATQS